MMISFIRAFLGILWVAGCAHALDNVLVWQTLHTVCNNSSTAVQVDTDFSNDADVRTMLLVHDTRPPFLDGRVIFTKQAEAIMPLRDPTSDLAVIAKSGSKLVKEIREKKNEGKSRQRFWEVAGSKMGKITGQSCMLPLLLLPTTAYVAYNCCCTLNLPRCATQQIHHSACSCMHSVLCLSSPPLLIKPCKLLSCIKVVQPGTYKSPVVVQA